MVEGWEIRKALQNMDGVGIGKSIRAVFILAILGWLFLFIGGMVVGVHFLAKFW